VALAGALCDAFVPNTVGTRLELCVGHSIARCWWQLDGVATTRVCVSDVPVLEALGLPRPEPFERTTP
jgi:hypothetical protein